ncbi:MAG: phage virion morphogenesis protein [Bacteroidales bacterium]|nr:phage virion morphogenesis protein [Candidatus Scybalousia scybalohippi]
MNLDKFSKGMAKFSIDMKKAYDKDLPRIIGNKAVMMFKQNFQEEGFFGQKWKEVKRRQDPKTKGAARFRAILTGSGDLGRSVKMQVSTRSVTIYSDLPYSSAHNDGTHTAGRGNHTTIPQRQFIGPHRKIDDMVQKVAINYLTKQFNKI